MAVGFNTFRPKVVDTVFVIRNITKGTPGEKTLRVFNYPIPPGKERDLLGIPEVSEADIRHSLLKGTLRVKGENDEFRIVRTNIDLLQFDDEQQTFIESLAYDDDSITGVDAAGIGGGGEVSFAFLFKQNVELLGTKDESNRVFTTPDKFINSDIGGNSFRILIRHNGKGLIQGVDYSLSESGGAGTGFDTINIIAFAPKEDDTLVADYVIPAP